MKNLILNSALLLILIVVPIIPGYLHIYNQQSNPKLKLCVENGRYGNMNILKGDLANLEAIFSRALENNDNEDPKSHELNNRINLFFFTSQSKFDFKDQELKINKLLYSKNNNFSTVYLKIPSPPPKNIS